MKEAGPLPLTSNSSCSRLTKWFRTIMHYVGEILVVFLIFKSVSLHKGLV